MPRLPNLKVGDFLENIQTGTLYIITELDKDLCIYKTACAGGSAYNSSPHYLSNPKHFKRVKPSDVYLYVRKAKLGGRKELASVKGMREFITDTLIGGGLT